MKQTRPLEQSTYICRFALLALILLLPAIGQAQTNYLTWTTNNGSITITGFQNNPTSLVIPATVTGLPVTVVEGFGNCFSLTSVIIPNGVNDIGQSAFYNCDALTSVSIPNSVTDIEAEAFQNCITLTSVTIPGSVTNLGYRAFFLCYDLTSVYFLGNAPGAGTDTSVFQVPQPIATAYYLAGTTGWGPTFDGLPTVMLGGSTTPQLTGVGAGSNGFGFTIKGTNTQVVVVQVSTNFASPIC